MGTTRPELLVSVRNATEAHMAADQGVRWLDVKDPTAGSLGRPSVDCVDQVVAAIGRRPCRLSIAWGELAEVRTVPPSRWRGHVRWIKLGLAHTAGRPEWPAAWQQQVRRLRAVAEPVAVVYADRPWAQCPAPLDVIHHAAAWGCRMLLLDTCNKTAGSLVDWWPRLPGPELLRAARRHRMRIVMAGSLTCDHLPQVLGWAPDLVAMRAGLCQDHRGGSLDPDKIQFALQQLRGCGGGPAAIPDCRRPANSALPRP